VTNNASSSGNEGHLTIVDFDSRSVSPTEDFAGFPETAVVETADGNRVLAVSNVAGSQGNRLVVHIFDSRTGDALGESESFGRVGGTDLETFEVSEDGNYALLEFSGAISPDTNTIRVIDTHTGATTVETFRLPDSEFVEFGGNGSRLYLRNSGESGVDDDSVTVFDTSDGAMLANAVELPGRIWTDRYADDGSGYFVYTGALVDGSSQLTIIGADGGVTRIPLVGSANTGKPGTLFLFNDDQSLAFVTTETDTGAPDFTGTTHVMVIDTSSKTALRTIDAPGFAAGHDYAIQANPDDTAALLVTGDDSSYYATVIDLRTGTMVGSPQLISVGDSTRTTLFSPSGHRAVVVISNEPPVGSPSTVVAVVDLRTGAVARTEVDGAFRPPGTGDGVFLNEDESHGIVITHLEDGTSTATALDLVTGTVGVTVPVDGEVSAIDFDKTGTVAAIHSGDEAVTIVDAAGHSAVVYQPTDGVGTTKVTFSDDGSRAYVSSTVDRAEPDDVFPDFHNVIRVVAIGQQGVSVIGTIEVDGSVWEPVVVSHDGRRAVIGASTALFGTQHAIYTIDTGAVSTQIV